jgi:subtilisin family serine protease
VAEKNNAEVLARLQAAPDTIDFIVRRSDYFEAFIDAEEEAVIAQQLGEGRLALAYASPLSFQNLWDTLGASFISSISLVLGLLDRASLEAASIIQVHQQPYLDLLGRGVIVGFVDTGIDYTQPTFIYEDGASKILYIYDQTGTGTPPEGFTIGTEYTNEQINLALGSDDPYSIVPHQDNSGHGTFLASIAAGRPVGDFIGAAPAADIIAVKMRKARPFYLERFAIPPEQENAYASSALIVGIEYILRKALELNRPVAICIGVGTNQGGHDGYTILEEYLANASNLRGVCICAAAGNESQARHHMQGIVGGEDESQNIDIKVGDQAGDIYISIWNNAADRMSVSVRSPTGELVSRVPARSGTRQITNLILERSRVLIEYYYPLEGSGAQVTVVKIYNATPGIWTITVYGDIILDGSFNAWLPLTGFVSPSVEFLAAAPYITITVPATMIGGISCGAYDSVENSLYALSSWGPTRLPVMAPDLVAPGVDVGGFYPYGYGDMSGTSVAAAITTGAGALMLQWGIVEGNDPVMSTYQIRAYLIRGCNRSESLTYPNTQWGYGSLNLLQSFRLMREV